MTTGDSNYLGELGLLVGLDVPQQEVDRLLKQTEARLAKKVEIPVGVRVGTAEQDLRAVRAEVDKLAQQSAKANREQAAAARNLREQHRASAAESAANTAKLREQAAAYTLTARMAVQAASEEKRRSQEGINGIENQVKAYRSLWQSRILSNDQVYAQQARLKQQALEMAATLDRQSDAYRRLTQVAAAAQRTMDASQGVNTPGGFGAGISQGITNALGQFGVTGDLIAGFVQLIGARRQQAQNTAEHLGRDTMAGLVQGMKSQQTKVTQTADDAADSVAEAIRASLDIHSPSRVMEYLGRMAGLGFVTGLKTLRDDARRAAQELATAAQAGARVNPGANGVSSAVSGGGFGGGNVEATAAALAALNAQLAANAAAAQGAGKAEEAAGAAVEGLGEKVSGATDHVRSLRDAKQEQDDASRQMAINEAKTALAFTATAAAIAGVAVAMAASFNSAANYEQAMDKAQATTEATTAQMAKLDALARSEQLVNLGVNGTKAAEGIEELGSQGLNTAQIIDGGLVASLTLAKAVNADVAKAAAVAASSTKAFGLESKDLAHVADIVTNAVNATSIKMDNFTDAIAAGGSTAKQTGLNFTEFTAAISFMTDKAINASDAGTSLKSFLSALTPNSKQAAAAMKELGLNAFDATGNWKPFAQIVEELRVAFSRLTPEQRASTAETIFGSDGIRAFNILVEQGADGLRERTQLLDRMGTAERAAADKLAGFRGEQERFNAALENFKITVGTSFLPGATRMLDWATGFLGKIDAINQKLATLESPKDIRATLQIEWGKDEPTVVAYKLLASGTHVLSDAVTTSFTAAQLEGELIKAGILERKLDPGAAATQQKLVADNMKFYQAALDEYRKATTAAAAQLAAALDPNKVKTGPAPLVGQGPLLPGQDRAGIVNGLAAITKLGPLRSGGTPYGLLYDPDRDGVKETHNGEDLFAKVGTPVMAAFSGMLETRWSTTTGRILELVDAQGKRMLLGHMQGVKGSLEGLPKDIQAAFAASGGKAIQVNAGQVIGYVGQTGSKANKKLGPDNAHVHLMAFDENGNEIDPKKANWVPGRTQAGTNTLANTKPFTPASDQALIAEARRILTNLEGYKKAGNLTMQTQAGEVLKAFADAGPRQAAAIEYARSKMQELTKETSKFGQGYDKLKAQLEQSGSLFKINDNAQAYIKSLDGIATAAQQAAAAEKKRNGETDKYRALLDLAGDAAGKARQQREGLKRDQDAAARDAATAATNRLKTQEELQRALAQGREQDARRALQSLKDQQAAELALAQNSATKRAQIIKQTGPAIIEAEDQLAELKRRAAVTANQRAYDAAAKLPGADLVALRATQKSLNLQAYKTEQDERAAARTQQAAAERTANQASLQAQQQHERERKAVLHKNAEEGRNLTVSAAEQRLKEIKGINERELASFKGTADERLRLIKRQSQAEYQAAVDLANAQKIAALQRSANEGGPNQAERDRQIREAYNLAVAELGASRAATVQTEVDREKKSVQDLREEYSRLADGLREKITAGTVTQEDLTEYWQSIVRIGQAGQEAGVSGNKFLQSAQLGAKGVHALAQGVIDAGSKLREFREEFDRTSDDIAAAADVALDDRNTDDVAEVARLKKLGPGMLLNFLGGPGNDNFGDKFWTRFGEEGRAEFMAALNSFDAEDFAKLPQSLLQAWAAQMGDDAQWAGVKAQVLSAIGKITDDVGRLADAKVQGQLGALDLKRANEEITEDDYLAQRTGILTTQETERWAREKKALEAKGYKAGDTLYELAFQEHQNRLTDIAVGGVKKRVEAEKEAATETISVLAGWQKSIEEATAQFDAGDMDQFQFAQYLDGAATELEALADEAARLGNHRLAEQFLAAAQNARELNPELVQIRQEMKAIADLGANFQKFTNGLGSLLRAVGANDLGTIADGLGSVVSEASKLPGQFREAERAWTAFKSKQTSGTLGDLLGNVGGMLGTAGAVIGAIVGIGNAIESMSPGLQAWKKDLREVAEEQKKALGANTGGFKSPWAAALEADAEARDKLASSNWLQRLGWSLFGGAPQVMKTESARLLAELQTIFADLGSGVAGIWQNTMLTAFRAGDMQGWAENFSKEFDLMFGETVLKTLINAAITEGAVANDLATLTEAVKNKDWAAIPGILTRAKNSAQAAGAEIAKVAPMLPGYGSGGSGGSAGGGYRDVGAAPIPQIGTSRVELTLPTDILAGFTAFNTGAPIFLEGSRTLLRAAQLIENAFRGGNGGPPPLSGNGGLV